MIDVATALGTYLEVVDSAAPGLVEGLYVVGSHALGDWQPGRSDIDVVAVLAEPASDEDFAALHTAHALFTDRQPYPHIDGANSTTTVTASRSTRSPGTPWPPTAPPCVARPSTR